MISNKHKCIFIHIPKTGGSSIGSVLNLNGFKHTPARLYIEEYGRDYWQSCFTFTIVRNPWDRIVSYYNWRGYRHKLNSEKCLDARFTFTDWIAYINDLIERKDNDTLNKIWAPRSHKFYANVSPSMLEEAWKIKLGNQSFMITDDSGEIVVDHVGRFENIINEFRYLSSRLALSKELPHENNLSQRRHYREFYDAETESIVRRLFQDDIERFGYSF